MEPEEAQGTKVHAPPVHLPEGWSAYEFAHAENGQTYTRFFKGKHTYVTSVRECIELEAQDAGLDPAPLLREYDDKASKKKNIPFESFENYNPKMSGLDDTVLAALPPDAPPGHASYWAMTAAFDAWRNARVQFFMKEASGKKENIQVTQKAAANNRYAMSRILRALHMKVFDEGLSKHAAIEFRDECLSRLFEVTGAGGAPPRQGAAKKERKRKSDEVAPNLPDENAATENRNGSKPKEQKETESTPIKVSIQGAPDQKVSEIEENKTGENIDEEKKEKGKRKEPNEKQAKKEERQNEKGEKDGKDGSGQTGKKKEPKEKKAKKEESPEETKEAVGDGDAREEQPKKKKKEKKAKKEKSQEAEEGEDRKEAEPTKQNKTEPAEKKVKKQKKEKEEDKKVESVGNNVSTASAIQDLFPIVAAMPDAPPGHPAHELSKAWTMDDPYGAPIVRFKGHFPAQKNLSVQVAIRKVDMSHEAALKITRACYVLAVSGTSNAEIKQYREDCYAAWKAAKTGNFEVARAIRERMPSEAPPTSESSPTSGGVHSERGAATDAQSNAKHRQSNEQQSEDAKEPPKKKAKAKAKMEPKKAEAKEEPKEEAEANSSSSSSEVESSVVDSESESSDAGDTASSPPASQENSAVQRLNPIRVRACAKMMVRSGLYCKFTYQRLSPGTAN
mmetsp:Transcript_67032/g.116685  ORF Transcript_67032/g.116685 Transcript_67032/m.116685 type:complete len:676 (-) Transcript_67032:92-2119(-)